MLKMKMVILFIDLNYQNIDIKVFFDKEKLYLKRLENYRYL